MKKTAPVVMVALALDSGTEVLERAIVAARGWDHPELHLVHAAVPPVYGNALSERVDRERIQVAEVQLTKAREHITKMGELAMQTFPGHVVVHLVQQTAADGILRAAERAEADLIVVGTRDFHGIKRLVLGSVASDVVARALCPVLVARPLGYPASTVPQIEPLCGECAKTRAETQNATLWCDRHRTKHPRALLHYEYPTGFGAGSQLLRV